MLQELERGGTCNRLLQELSDDDFGLLREHLSPVVLPIRKKLEAPNKSVGTVYFLESGAVSIVANGPQDCSLCVGLIGSEGATGLPVFMGNDSSPNETTVQFAGEGQQIAAGQVRSAMAQSASLRATLLSYCLALTNQLAQTALANGWNTIEERLARWLCMAHDRSDSDELTLTHERLGDLLGVRRPAITLALARLEQDRSIHVRRGSIAIVDRLRLEQKTGGMYGRSEHEFERLLMPSADEPLRSYGVLDVAYYVVQREKSVQRVSDAEMRCNKQRTLLERLEGEGKPSPHGRALLATMESTLVLMRKQLWRIQRSIELERGRAG